ncbi:hypothetical protein HAX54_051945 [Datura stramonium]|uniref:Uncharacterized protein n=1 Tax=Datura stramonium TaxID=4076 RepID=A0ABS8WRT8_DATST|nr:hypothetical protein [Datura stramonium]
MAAPYPLSLLLISNHPSLPLQLRRNTEASALTPSSSSLIPHFLPLPINFSLSPSPQTTRKAPPFIYFGGPPQLFLSRPLSFFSGETSPITSQNKPFTTIEAISRCSPLFLISVQPSSSHFRPQPH